ncbi:unnamed protein product [Linum trigynum]|uniref:Uncharacterized protein n=1 Tax=Linum trigynum TaxID=586398 RepID=A0AAV2FCC3_9ROSI
MQQGLCSDRLSVDRLVILWAYADPAPVSIVAFRDPRTGEGGDGILMRETREGQLGELGYVEEGKKTKVKFGIPTRPLTAKTMMAAREMSWVKA